MNHTQFSLTDSFLLWDDVEDQAKECGSLESAAQACVETLYARFPESLALVRVFATVRFQDLPPLDRAGCLKLAATHGIQALLKNDTIILSLMATRGTKEEWNERSRSAGHLGVPLVSSEFAGSIPMIASLMKDMGIGLDWLDTKNTDIIVHNRGRSAAMFYVEDARTATDRQGRRIVPAQDFVQANGLRTVFGVGGGYLNGTFISTIFFTRETLSRLDVERFLPLVHALKAGSMNAVMGRRFFGANRIPSGNLA